MKSLAIAASLLALVAPGRDAPGPVLTFDGFGPVRIGMTAAQAQAALGRKFKFDDAQSGDVNECAYAWRADGKDSNVLYMIEKKRITRIDISNLNSHGRGVTGVVTAAGIGIGASEQAVRRAYGAAVIVAPAPYETGGQWLKVKDRGGRHGFVFETEHGRVTTFRTGERAAIDYMEGCA